MGVGVGLGVEDKLGTEVGVGIRIGVDVAKSVAIGPACPPKPCDGWELVKGSVGVLRGVIVKIGVEVGTKVFVGLGAEDKEGVAEDEITGSSKNSSNKIASVSSLLSIGKT